MIKIDKGVPLSAIAGKNGRPPIYPWLEMEIGDSFFVADKTAVQISAVVSQAKKRYFVDLTIRTVTENGVTGVRVWRIK